MAAGAAVLEGSRFEARSHIAGVPAKLRRELTEEKVAALAANAGHYVDLATRHRAATTG